MATAGDSDLGGQDFTNAIFELISPKLDEFCEPQWRNKLQFVNNVAELEIKSKIDGTLIYANLQKKK